MKNKRSLLLLKIILFITFTSFLSAVYFITQHDMQLRKETVLSQQITNLSNTYKVSMNRFEVIADSINSTVINTEDVLKILYKAKHTSSEDSLIPLRSELYKIMKPHFDNLKKIGVIITLFSFENNKTFLRVHKPNKFDDDLSKNRYSFKYVNENKKIIRGLEEGKIMHAFRNIYPIFYKGEYLGSVDIAFSSSVLKEHMENLYKTKAHFIINKNVFMTNIWKMKDMVNYSLSFEHENFLQNKQEQITAIEKNINKKLKKNIYQNISHNKAFALEDSAQIVSFLPVKNIKDKKTVAYLVSYEESDYLKNLNKEHILLNLLSFILAMIIHIIIYISIKNRFRDNEAKNREVENYLDIAQVLIMVLDNNKNVMMINKEGAKLLGYTQDEMIGKNWVENFLPKNIQTEISNIATDIIEIKKNHSGNKNYVLTKSGELKLILWKNSTLHDAKGNVTGILTSGQDVTEQDKSNVALKKATLEAEKANRSKSEFLANMSHEIRTPLNGILGFVDLLYKDEKDLKKQERLKIIKDSSHALIDIVNDILDFSKIETGKLLIEKTPVNIVDVFSKTVQLFTEKAKEKNIKIKLALDDEIPKFIVGDSTRIKQIISNLISNALKFSDENSEIKVNVNYLYKTHEIYCEILDTGIGITKDRIDNIFEAFEQEDSSTTRKYGGTGLGLSIVKLLIKLMDGDIGVTSEFGKGSKFYFTLPVIEANENLKEENTITNTQEILKGNILIVEDNKTNQMLLSILLEDFGLDYDIANDGLEAVEKVKDNSCYDLILMDENMPNMNGMEASKIIKQLEHTKDITIIAVTANALKGDREKFLENGMDDYISKPIDVDVLEKTLRKYL